MEPQLQLAGIFVLGIGAQWIAWRLGIPSIVLLLTIGFLAGPVTHALQPDVLMGDSLLFAIVSLSVSLILFEGGLSLRISELRDMGVALWGLLSVGAFVTWTMSTFAAYYLLDFSFPLALLLGAILVVTGPTVVGPLLNYVRPIGRVGSIAKWEGIIIDPIGASLAVLVLQSIEAIHGANFWQATLDVSIGLFKTAVVGGVMTVVGVTPILFLLRRYLVPDFLQSPVMLMAVVAAFAGSNLLQKESGLLTVTLMGVWLANQKSVDVKHIVEFKENLRVLLLSSLFILLAARLDVSTFKLLDWRVFAFVGCMILVVRPSSVLLATLRTELSWREKVFLSWIAPRGVVAASVASVFALDLGGEGEALVPVTFLVIVGTVVVYGVTLSPLTRWLGLSTANPQGVLFVSAHPAARAIALALKQEGFQVLLVDSNRENARMARLEGLPSRDMDVLSDQALRDLNLGGIGKFLAMTRNDEVNQLAALRFTETFGRAQVFQLAKEPQTKTDDEMSHRHLRGRTLFAKHANYAYLDRRFANGAVVKRTKLTAEFDYKAFKEHYGESALPLFIVTETGVLNVCTAESTPAPKKGQTVIALVDPVGEPETAGGVAAPQPQGAS